MEQVTQSPPLLRLLCLALARRGTPAVGRRWLCSTAAAARRRDIPRYRFELENRLLFGGVLKKPGRAAQSADTTASESSPPTGITVVSETGFLEGRLGKPVRSRSKSAVHAATASSTTAPTDSTTALATSTTTGSGTSSSASPLSSTSATSAPLSARAPVVSPPISYLYPEDDADEAVTEPAASLPSVSRVLQATMSEESREALRRWEQMMVARHGVDGFAQVKEAMFSAGREFHDAIHGHLSGLAPEQPLSDAAAGFWRSVRPVLQHVNAPERMATELPLRHDRLGYQGIVDCVAPFRSCPMVLEWKTARRPKYSVRELYDNPIQAAAYLGAFNYTHRKTQVDRAAVVVAYESGRPATVHVLSPAACRHYWALWLRRLLQYRQETGAV